MKFIFTVLTLFTIAGPIFSQTPITKEIGDFKELKTFDLIEVELIQASDNKVEISGHNAKAVQVVNLNGLLKIRMQIKEAFDGARTQVRVFYKNLDIIDANEGSKITANDVIKQYDLELRAQEGGQINLEAETSYLKVKSVTGGIINATGSTKNLDLNLRTGGIFEGEQLISNRATVSIKAGGEAYVNTTKNLEVKIRAGGNVYVYGKPAAISEDIVLGGTVKQM